MAAAIQCALHGVQQLSWPAKTPDPLPIEHVWDLMKRELNSFSRACHNHCRIAKMGARYLGQSIVGWHSAPLWPFACENTHLGCCQRGPHCVLMWLFGHPLLLLLLFFLLGFTTLLNILGHQCCFWHRAWKGRQILLTGSNFGLRFFYIP